MDTYNTEVNSVSDIISLAVPSKETVDYMDQHIGLNQTQRAAARYNAWNLECANGTHNNFPGLKEIAMKEETRLRDFLEGN